MTRPRAFGIYARTAALLLAGLVAATAATPASAQSSPRGFRVGLTLGGISFVGLTLEYQWTDRSVEATVGTWAFKDLSVAVAGKQYLGPGALRPYFGVGLWGVAAFDDDGTGAVLVARAPVGADWRALGENYMGLEMALNRGLWVRRIDPEDQRPLNRRLVPLPGFYYRYRP